MRFRRTVFLWLAPCLLWAAADCQAKEVISGPQYRDATLKSIDVLSSHLTLLQAQAEHDQILNNISYTIRFAPANLLLNDSSVNKGSFVRSLLPSSVGLGSVSGIGFFVGLQGDYIKVFDLDTKDDTTSDGQRSGVGTEVSQVIAFAGISLLGFQLDAGIIGGVGFVLDKDLQFAKYKTQQVKDTSFLSAKPRYVYTLYHKSGIYLSTIFKTDTLTGKQTLSDFKLNIQPLKNYLPDFYGLPFLDLLAYTPLSPAYSKYTVQDTTSGNSKSVSKEKKDYEVSFGSDDFFTTGFRPDFTILARPHLAFRKLDFSYVRCLFGNSLVLGSRASYFVRNGNSNLSVDAFGVISFSEVTTLGLSYSYNSPDNVTFLPLPGLHVFGVQLIWGARETAKKLFPYVSGIVDD